MISFKKKKLDQTESRAAAPDQDPEEEQFRPAPGYNLAGRPLKAERKLGGIYEQQIKTVTPIVTGDLNTTPFLHFVVRANSREWIRLKRNSISALIYGLYPNPSKSGTSGESGADNWSLRPLKGKPCVFFDPSVMGTCLVESVDTMINGVPVTSNHNLNHFLTQYTRLCHVFNHKADVYLAEASKISFDHTSDGHFPAPLRAGMEPLNYNGWDKTEGKRLPIYMDGIFPFDNICRVREALMNQGHENLFFPPGTQLDIRVNLKRDMWKQLFFQEHFPFKTKYWSSTAITDELPAIKMTLQDVTLAYESNMMEEQMHLTTMAEFKRGSKGIYHFDVVGVHYQGLLSSQSFTRNEFQIPPKTSMLMIMFQQDHAVFYTPTQKKPTSGFSMFPDHCTEMKVKFNGSSLIAEQLKNLGLRNNHTEISKSVLYDYLKNKRLYGGKFETYFPDNGDYSLNQVLIFDVEGASMTETTNLLTLEAFFDNTKSPANIQIVVFSIHATGRGEVKLLNQIEGNYEWRFFNE